MKKILLVDDDRINTTLIGFALKEAGFQIVSAEDGKKGLEIFEHEQPDLIVLDIQMPEMSGFEFMGELKSFQGGSSVPVIMLTANANMGDVFFSEGVKGYFVKPVDPPKLVAKVREVLQYPAGP